MGEITCNTHIQQKILSRWYKYLLEINEKKKENPIEKLARVSNKYFTREYPNGQ